MWAGFLSRPLVKQTSKVDRQRRSLVLTASFTSSTAFSTSSSSGLALPSAIAPPLLLYLINHNGIVMVKLLPVYTATQLLQQACPSLNRQTGRQEAVDPAGSLYIGVKAPLCCHPGHELQWDGPGQNAQVPKQGDRGAEFHVKT